MNVERFRRKAQAIVRRSPSRGRPYIRWLNQIQDLTLERLGIAREYLSGVAEDRQKWVVNLGILGP